MYFHTETQKFLVLVPQERPAAQFQVPNTTTATPLTSPQLPSGENEFSATPPLQKTIRSDSASSTASTEMKSGFLRLGV
ncbi:hypothetical protein AJ78_07439 [Emergomyces pasteurianus Ep9510]|uniref:Uncharacterized protein n=1 Tax=Emergomyces pasteurianus Ep9510 TaxID=1447872 RepID=A0A1J9Q7H8_9EURO|nr:hypothetical protein AJ78_07439 [Emergomyces pasteurianus Ep9510]